MTPLTHHRRSRRDDQIRPVADTALELTRFLRGQVFFAKATDRRQLLVEG